MTYVLVAVAGAVGAVARYATGVAVGTRSFPWSILAVNVAGCFALGALVTWAEGRWSPAAVTAVGAGFLGAFTTFSTFATDTVLLADDGRSGAAAANVVLSVVLGLAAAAAGRALAR